jgi:hypothetical protein
MEKCIDGMKQQPLGWQMKINLELTIEEINQILGTLDQMPYRQVATLIDNIKAQAMAAIEQQKPQE